MQNWNQWQLPPSTVTTSMPQPPVGYSTPGTDPMAIMQAYMQYYSQPAPSGYTQEQWATAQQQNWTQWQQWQQQFQQWQAQYGEKYHETMKQFSAQNMPNVASQAPPLPNVQPPPLPKDDAVKPPLPPDNMYKYSSMPPPHQNDLPLFPSKQPGTGGAPLPPNYTPNPPPPPKQPPLPADNRQPSSNEVVLGEKRAAGSASESASAKKCKIDDEELTEAEKTFDAQFKQWEEQFNKWKQQNANHPDKTQYKQYEAKWTSWREKLIERREQMRRKREQQKQAAARAEAEKNKNLPGGDKILNILSSTENQGLLNNLLGIGKTLGLTGKQDISVAPPPPPDTTTVTGHSSSMSTTSTAQMTSIPAQPMISQVPTMSTRSVVHDVGQTWGAQPWNVPYNAGMTMNNFAPFQQMTSMPPPPISMSQTQLSQLSPLPPTNFSQPPPNMSTAPPSMSGMPNVSTMPPNMSTMPPNMAMPNMANPPPSGMSNPPPNMANPPPNFSQPPPGFGGSDMSKNKAQNSATRPPPGDGNYGMNKESFHGADGRFGQGERSGPGNQFAPGSDNYGRGGQAGNFGPDDRGGPRSQFGPGNEQFGRDQGRDFGPSERFRQSDGFERQSRNEQFNRDESFAPGNKADFGNNQFGRDGNRGGQDKDNFNPSERFGSGSGPGFPAKDQSGPGNDRFGPNDRFGSGDRFGPNDKFNQPNERFGSDNDRFGQGDENAGQDNFGSGSRFGNSGDRFGPGSDRFGQGGDRFGPGSDRFGSGGNFGPGSENDDRFGSGRFEKGNSDRFDSGDARRGNFGNSSRGFGRGQFDFSDEVAPELKKLMEKRRTAMDAFKPRGSFLSSDPKLDVGSLSESFKKITGDSPFLSRPSNESSTSRGPENFGSRGPGFGAEFGPRGASNFGPRGPPDFGPRGPNFGPRGPSDFRPRGPGDFSPRGPSDFGPRGPGDFGPRGPSDFGPRGPGDFGPRGPPDFGPRGPNHFSPRGPGNFGPRGPSDFGPHGPGDSGPLAASGPANPETVGPEQIPSCNSAQEEISMRQPGDPNQRPLEEAKMPTEAFLEGPQGPGETNMEAQGNIETGAARDNEKRGQASGIAQREGIDFARDINLDEDPNSVQNHVPPLEMPPWMDPQFPEIPQVKPIEGPNQGPGEALEKQSGPQGNSEKTDGSSGTANLDVKVDAPNEKSDALPFMGENDPKPEDLNMEPPPDLPNLGPMVSGPNEPPFQNSELGKGESPFKERDPDQQREDGRQLEEFNSGPRDMQFRPMGPTGPRGPLDGRFPPFGPRGPNDGPFGSARFGFPGPNEGPFGPRGPNDRLFGPRGPQDGSFGSRGPNDGPFGSRGPRNGPFGPRGFNDGPFGTRGPGDRFGLRGPNDGSFRFKSPDVSFGSRGPNSGPFGSRGPNDRPFAPHFGPRGPNDEPFGHRGPEDEPFGPRGPIDRPDSQKLREPFEGGPDVGPRDPNASQGPNNRPQGPAADSVNILRDPEHGKGVSQDGNAEIELRDNSDGALDGPHVPRGPNDGPPGPRGSRDASPMVRGPNDEAPGPRDPGDGPFTPRGPSDGSPGLRGPTDGPFAFRGSNGPFAPRGLNDAPFAPRDSKDPLLRGPTEGPFGPRGFNEGPFNRGDGPFGLRSFKDAPFGPRGSDFGPRGSFRVPFGPQGPRDGGPFGPRGGPMGQFGPRPPFGLRSPIGEEFRPRGPPDGDIGPKTSNEGPPQSGIPSLMGLKFDVPGSMDQGKEFDPGKSTDRTSSPVRSPFAPDGPDRRPGGPGPGGPFDQRQQPFGPGGTEWRKSLPHNKFGDSDQRQNFDPIGPGEGDLHPPPVQDVGRVPFGENRSSLSGPIDDRLGPPKDRPRFGGPMSGPFTRRNGNVHPGFRRPPIHEFCIEKQFNYNHGGTASECMDDEHVPTKVIDYAHVPKTTVQDYATPAQCFDYGHGNLKPVVPEHEVSPQQDFRNWEETEQNLKEYSEKMRTYERTLRQKGLSRVAERKDTRSRERDRDDRPRREVDDREYRDRDHAREARMREYDRERAREKERDKERERDRDKDRDRERERDRERDRDKSDRDRDREREKERDRERDKDRDKDDRSNGKERGRDRSERSRKDAGKDSSKEDESGLASKKDAPPEPPKTLELPKTPNCTMVDDLLCPPGRQNRPPKIVIILRGPPGSGKSFVAKLIKDKEVEQGGSAPRILSLDDYFLAEKEVETKDDNGKKVVVKEMVYEYEEAMEQSYLTSLTKAFKKNITDGFFNFIILDSINEKISDYEELWSFAKTKGFRVYVCEMEMDVQICLKRNVHNRSEDEINRIVDYFEPTPSYHQTLDVNSMLQEQAIEEVDMEDTHQPEPELEQNPVTDDGQDSQDDKQESTELSKWERMETEDKLDRLDGLAKKKNDKKPQTMEDFLQVPDYYDMEDTSGKKRVRWADLEERKEQEKMRAVGFVVGHTNWDRMMDPTMGGSALTRTKFFPMS
ncbi:collagen alpha-1(VII) chain isoform X2 [Orussus abietinus]|uniref:collagen alpha-1(VII) chain isoform X2 n=1 Tax=Orussus abietinus TaxID=222816 RepID=UPI0006250397|nr:collagen alpha-1(VII) chain isoform X2 [Orussus abietinus]